MSSTPSREEVLFADALGRPEHERVAFLDQACDGDAAQKARLLALLAAHDGPATLLASAAGSPSLRHSAPPEERPGDTIGHYKLFQKLSESGCGVGWLAEQDEPVRRRVTLKIIKLGMDTKAVVARFEAERQALPAVTCNGLTHGLTPAGLP